MKNLNDVLRLDAERNIIRDTAYIPYQCWIFVLDNVKIKVTLNILNISQHIYNNSRGFVG